MQQIVTQFLDHIAYERGLAANTRLAYGAELEAFTTFMAAREIGRASCRERV